MKILKKVFLIVILAVMSTTSLAQIKIVVPYAAGGAIDQMARNFAKYIETTTGEISTVENVTGAGSIIGTQRLLSLNPNNSLLFTNNSHFMNIIQGSFKENEFKVVSIIGETPYVLVGSKTKNLTCSDLKNSTRKFFLGTTGKDSASSSAAALIIKKHSHFFEVPYRGISAALIDVLGDRIDITFGIGNSYDRPDTNLIANTSRKKFNNIISWNECLGITENFIVEYLVISNSSASSDFVTRMNSSLYMFAKDPKTISNFKDIGITDLTSNLSETEKKAKESFFNLKQIYQFK